MFFKMKYGWAMSSELGEGDAVTTSIEKYEEFKANIRNGKYGKAAKF